MEFKNIRGWGGQYQVASDGTVKSVGRTVPHGRHGQVNVQEKILKPALTNDGYMKVALASGGVLTVYRVHRLVAKTFLPNPDKLPEINHKDGDKTNNDVSNLEWCTHQYNVQHSFDNGLQIPLKGEDIATSKLTEQDVINIRQEAVEMKEANGRYWGRKELADKYGVTESHIKDIISGRRNLWNHIQ